MAQIRAIYYNMILGNKAICEALERGDIIIDPFKTQNLQTSSYDVTLGDWYIRQDIDPIVMNDE